MPSELNPDESIRDWETVQHNSDGDRTERLRVVGGWLYRTFVSSGAVALVFVPSQE